MLFCRTKSAPFRRSYPALFTTIQQHKIFFSSQSPTPVLTRDFIYSALYRNDHGYFTNPVLPVITQPSQPINFTDMLGKQEYLHQLQQIYKSSMNGWLTPVEIFAPWYSYAVAAYIIQHHLNRIKSFQVSKSLSSSTVFSLPLSIYEIGGGNGTHAKYMLEYIQKKVPSIYQTMTYKILEVSPHLQHVQTITLQNHRQVARSVCVDGMMIHESLPTDERYSYITAFEVLDNLPHDKIVAFKSMENNIPLEQPSSWCEQNEPLGIPLPDRSTSTNKNVKITDKYSNYIYETYVESLSPSIVPDSKGSKNDSETLPRLIYQEKYKPLQDKYIREVYRLWQQYQNDKIVSNSTDPLVQTLDNDDEPISTFERSVNWIKQSISPTLPPVPEGYQYARYLPTGCYQLLHSIRQAFPHHSLLLADFTYLPPPKIVRSTIDNDAKVLMYAPGKNRPIVASKRTAIPTSNPTNNRKYNWFA